MKKATLLEQIPAEDPTSKTINYIKTNGDLLLQGNGYDHDAQHLNGFQNGAVMRSEVESEEAVVMSSEHGRATGQFLNPDSGISQATEARKKKTRRSAMGLRSHDIQTRLRARKPQTGL